MLRSSRGRGTERAQGGFCAQSAFLPLLHRDIRLTDRASYLQWAFSGISTFAHLKHVRCLTTPSELYDIAIVGAPFDTAVSYRPGRSPSPRINARSRRCPYLLPLEG